jgi:hypothetical protein
MMQRGDAALHGALRRGRQRHQQREMPMFEYQVVPIVITRGAGGTTALDEWRDLEAALNERGQRGFRVVAVTDGQEGRAVIMERPAGGTDRPRQRAASRAGQLTRGSSREGR